jgi:oligoendopeptidase F
MPVSIFVSTLSERKLDTQTRKKIKAAAIIRFFSMLAPEYAFQNFQSLFYKDN